MPYNLKTYDVAVLLDLSPDDVNAMARKGRIRGYKLGNQWRFRSRDIKNLLDHALNQMMSSGGFENPKYKR